MTREQMIATLALLGWQPLTSVDHAVLLCNPSDRRRVNTGKEMDCIWAGNRYPIVVHRYYQRISALKAFDAGDWAEVGDEVLQAVADKVLS